MPENQPDRQAVVAAIGTEAYQRNFVKVLLYTRRIGPESANESDLYALEVASGKLTRLMPGVRAKLMSARCNTSLVRGPSSPPLRARKTCSNSSAAMTTDLC